MVRLIPGIKMRPPRIEIRDLIALSAVSVMILVLFWPVVTLKSALLKGDYLSQFYPWLMVYSESVKHFTLPFWTRYVQCGFPLFAEGQIGPLYPLNLVLYFLLPFKAAYNYSFLFHLLGAGAAMFFYMRTIGAARYGSAIAALILCLGSTYAGAFINIANLQSLAYFPLTLMIAERCAGREKPGTKIYAALGFVWGIQLLAGSFQMTAYSVLFGMLYFFARRYPFGPGNAIRTAGGIIISAAVAVSISAPQLAATAELAGLSMRASRTLDFALWNSFSPLAAIALVLPSLGGIFVKSNSVYMGMSGLFLALVYFFSRENDVRKRVFLGTVIAALFFALGKYNPLYVFLLKAVELYSFRAPARLMYFVSFFLAAAAGKGFGYLFEERRNDGIKKASMAFFLITGISLSVFASLKVAFKFFMPEIRETLQKYVETGIYGKEFHRYSLDHYMAKLDLLMNETVRALSLASPDILYSLISVATASILVYVLQRESSRKKFLVNCFATLVIIDLVAAWSSFQGPFKNLAPYDSLAPREEKIYDLLKADQSLYRIATFGPQKELPEWIYFNTNTAWGIDSIGIYTPLMNRDYYLKMRDLGIVDDSIGTVPPIVKALEIYRELLGELNVKYVLSSVNLDEAFLKEVANENGLHLYILDTFLPRIRFEPLDLQGIKGNDRSVITGYDSGRVEATVSSGVEGKLIFAEKCYPGWVAFVDGKKVKIEKDQDILQSIRLSPGEHRVIFKFDPVLIKILMIISVLIFFACIVFLIRR
ncbi:MAG: YfhO family protein [Candidatus Omnitrophica bacterium]|nr:YfhO family protein [Candidatus Omnitrophota bacterium]